MSKEALHEWAFDRKRISVNTYSNLNLYSNRDSNPNPNPNCNSNAQKPFRDNEMTSCFG